MLKRVRSAWVRHGPSGFVRLLAKNVYHFGRWLISGRALKAATEVSSFDRETGGLTEAVREIGSLDIDSANARHAVRYQPSPANFVTELLGGLNIPHEQFTFIDYGAGKGRVLMIAARWPFRSVIGVEFAMELCRIADANLALPDPDRRAGDLRCLHQDATTFTVPDGPIVCYFYNPFGATVMQVVVDRLLASLRAAPRDAYVVYVHPEHRHVFEASQQWSELTTGRFHVVYRLRDPG